MSSKKTLSKYHGQNCKTNYPVKRKFTNYPDWDTFSSVNLESFEKYRSKRKDQWNLKVTSSENLVGPR